MKYITLELSTGVNVRVYPVPPYVINAVIAKFKEPPIPNRPVNPEVDIPGANQTIPDPDNPQYKIDRQKYLLDRAEAFSNARLLYGLMDEKPDEKWPTEDDKERWEFLGINPEIPTKGEGRRLAYLKFGLLLSGSDVDTVYSAIDSFNIVDEEAVKALIDSFRNKGSGDTAK